MSRKLKRCESTADESLDRPPCVVADGGAVLARLEEEVDMDASVSRVGRRMVRFIVYCVGQTRVRRDFVAQDSQ